MRIPIHIISAQAHDKFVANKHINNSIASFEKGRNTQGIGIRVFTSITSCQDQMLMLMHFVFYFRRCTSNLFKQYNIYIYISCIKEKVVIIKLY